MCLTRYKAYKFMMKLNTYAKHFKHKEFPQPDISFSACEELKFDL